MREGADVLDERDEADARRPSPSARRAAASGMRSERNASTRSGQPAEEALDRLQVERSDLDDRAQLRRRVHLRDGQLVDRVLRRRDPEPLAGEEEEKVRPRDGCEDLGDLLLVLLEPRIRDAEEEMPVLAGDDAVPEEREDDLLRDVQPLRADLAPLVVEEDLGARPEEVGDRLLELLPGLDERIPFEVRQRAVARGRAPPAARSGSPARAARPGAPSSPGASSPSGGPARASRRGEGTGAAPRQTRPGRARRERRSPLRCRRSPRPRPRPSARPRRPRPGRSSRAAPGSRSGSLTRSMKTASSLTSFEPYERRCHVP